LAITMRCNLQTSRHCASCSGF